MRATQVATIACLLPVLLACAKGDADKSSPEVRVQGTAVASRGGTTSQVPLGTRPTDQCGWIPAADVEALIGPFAEPPRPSGGGCLYTLQVPAELAAKRAKIAEFEKRIGSTFPTKQQAYALVLQVDVGVKTGERAARLTGEKLASWMKSDRAESSGWDAGWDAMRFNGGRLGSIDVTAIPESYEVRIPREKLRELTARVRDRVPDLPFAAGSDVYQDASPDPCTVLTREEAESVLGKLVVAPYRSVNGGPLALPNGTSCSYFTARHHALIVTPHWSNGKSELAATRGVGGLVGLAVNDSEAQSADTIEGPWDETAVSVDGRLVLRKADRAVEIEYETSSTNKAGALRLGKLIVERLAAGR